MVLTHLLREVSFAEDFDVITPSSKCYHRSRDGRQWHGANRKGPINISSVVDVGLQILGIAGMVRRIPLSSLQVECLRPLHPWSVFPPRFDASMGTTRAGLGTPALVEIPFSCIDEISLSIPMKRILRMVGMVDIPLRCTVVLQMIKLYHILAKGRSPNNKKENHRTNRCPPPTETPPEIRTRSQVEPLPKRTYFRRGERFHRTRSGGLLGFVFVSKPPSRSRPGNLFESRRWLSYDRENLHTLESYGINLPPPFPYLGSIPYEESENLGLDSIVHPLRTPKEMKRKEGEKKRKKSIRSLP